MAFIGLPKGFLGLLRQVDVRCKVSPRGVAVPNNTTGSFAGRNGKAREVRFLCVPPLSVPARTSGSVQLDRTRSAQFEDLPGAGAVAGRSTSHFTLGNVGSNPTGASALSSSGRTPGRSLEPVSSNSLSHLFIYQSNNDIEKLLRLIWFEIL